MSDLERRNFIIDTLRQGQTGIDDWARSIPEDCAFDFSYFEFDEDITFEELIFPRKVNFRDAIFHIPAHFETAQFAGGADFENSEFMEHVNFDRAEFKEQIKFEKAKFYNVTSFLDCKFHKGVNFSQAKFSDQANFIKAKFCIASEDCMRGKANFPQNDKTFFSSVQFNGGALFVHSIFNAPVWFNNTQFNSGTDFSKTEFKNEALFWHSKFEKNGTFSDTIFGGVAKFWDVVFKKNAFFTSTNFKSKAEFFRTKFDRMANFKLVRSSPESRLDFGSAQFNDPVVFNDAELLGKVKFRAAHFKSALDLSYAKFAFAPDFRLTIMQAHLSLHSVDIKQRDPYRKVDEALYCRLKELAALAQDHDREQYFFAHELKAMRLNQSRLRRIPSYLYEWCSDFGRSIWRPVFGLFITWLLSACLFTKNSECFKYPINCADLGNGFQISTTVILPFLAASRARLNEGFDGWLAALAFAEGLLGLVFIFLIGLALRNRFRI